MVAWILGLKFFTGAQYPESLICLLAAKIHATLDSSQAKMVLKTEFFANFTSDFKSAAPW
jgi:hypothetical protein